MSGHSPLSFDVLHKWNRVTVMISAETIPTLKNRESIHFAKFGHDTRADTLFWRIDSFYESILGKIQHIYEHKGCQICIMEVEKGFYSSSKQPSLF